MFCEKFWQKMESAGPGRAQDGSMRSILLKSFGERSRASVWKIIVLSLVLCSRAVMGQSILFDFDNAPLHFSLPLLISAGGVTAQFSDTGQGFSVQPANTMGFTPAGFSGRCIYPNSVFAADLIVSFSKPVSSFSILYAPEEYACDSSATMKVTAYLNGVVVGTATTNAQAGTWPTETLAITNAQGFDSVVVHYQAAPVTGGDYGPIFMVDNMVITPIPQPTPPIVLQGEPLLADRSFRFSFTNNPSSSFLVLASGDLSLPLNQWVNLGSATETAVGQYQFSDMGASATAQRFYCVQRQ